MTYWALQVVAGTLTMYFTSFKGNFALSSNFDDAILFDDEDEALSFLDELVGQTYQLKHINMLKTLSAVTYNL